MDIRMSLAYIAAQNGEPNYQFGGSVTDNTQAAWDAVDWEDSRTKPTWAEIEAAWPDAEKAFYSQYRVQEYPPIGDQIDAIMKGFNSLADQGYTLPQETLDWVSQCLSVKTAYPKPANPVTIP
jgi:hypothetical protein